MIKIGFCKYSNQCTFAHGQNEIRAPKNQPK